MERQGSEEALETTSHILFPQLVSSAKVQSLPTDYCQLPGTLCLPSLTLPVGFSSSVTSSLEPSLITPAHESPPAFKERDVFRDQLVKNLIL